MEAQSMEVQSMEAQIHEETVIQADEVIIREQYHFNINMVKVDEILIKCKFDEIFYSFNLIEKDKWWQENKQLFQQDFNEFFKILTSALEKRSSDFEVMITNKYSDNLNVTITYQSPYFKFEVLFKLVKEPSLEDKITTLQSEMKQLQLDNIKLQLDNLELHQEIKKINTIQEEQDPNDDWQIFKLTDTFPGKNIETNPCKTIEDMEECKAYCRHKKYGAFVVSGETAYFRNYSRKECLAARNTNPSCETYIAPIESCRFGQGVLRNGFHGLQSESPKNYTFFHYKKIGSELSNPLWNTNCEPHLFCSNCKFIKNDSSDVDTYECLGHIDE